MNIINFEKKDGNLVAKMYDYLESSKDYVFRLSISKVQNKNWWDYEFNKKGWLGDYKSIEEYAYRVSMDRYTSFKDTGIYPIVNLKGVELFLDTYEIDHKYKPIFSRPKDIVTMFSFVDEYGQDTSFLNSLLDLELTIEDIYYYDYDMSGDYYLIKLHDIYLDSDFGAFFEHFEKTDYNMFWFLELMQTFNDNEYIIENIVSDDFAKLINRMMEVKIDISDMLYFKIFFTEAHHFYEKSQSLIKFLIDHEDYLGFSFWDNLSFYYDYEDAFVSCFEENDEFNLVYFLTELNRLQS